MFLIEAVPQLVRPPAIAKMAGFTLGLTTVEAFERRHGTGLVGMGGHSNGARYWLDKTTGISIHTDGFNFAKGGEIVDEIWLDWSSENSEHVPKIRLKKDELGILGFLHLGMSRKEVDRIFKGKLNATDNITQPGVIRYSKAPINKDTNKYTKWWVHFDFGRKGLEGLQAGAD